MPKINPKKLHRDYMSEIEGSLEKKGVKFFDNISGLNITEEYLTLPAEVTEITSRELGEYLNAFTQQKVYLRTLLGRLELLTEEARRKYIEVSTPHYKELSKSKMSETAKERLVNSEEDVKEVFYELDDCRNKCRLVELNITSVEEIIFMLSREVTRRNSDFDDENRNYNVGRM